MSKFICDKCGYISVSWYGKCPQCQEFNSFAKTKDQIEKKNFDTRPAKYKRLDSINVIEKNRLKSGSFELDRVLGGGFLRGAAVFIAGEPGIGKSTLLLRAVQNLSVLYVSGEESETQVKARAERLGVSMKNFYYSSESSVEAVLQLLKKEKSKFDIVVIDSVQTCYTSEIPSPSGTISQIRQVVTTFVDFGKENDLTFVLVGHITKGGEIAGPKTAEHLVDCVLYLQGGRDCQFRILRSLKNRFGSTDEVGVFEMTEKGLIDADYSDAFIDKNLAPIAGRAIAGVKEGSRVLFYEIQSLAVPSSLAVPRRVVSGVDFNKLQLLIAVLRKYLKLPIEKYDIFVNVAGGVSVKSTAADLAIIAAVYSSIKNKPIAADAIFSGEIGLLGEIRAVWGSEKIYKQAKKYKFAKVYGPPLLFSVQKLQTLI